MSAEDKSIECPSCGARLDGEDFLMVLFSKATVVACPVCKKTISLKPSDF